MSQPPAPERGNRSLLIIVIVLLLVIICGGGVPVVGILAAIAIPNFVQMQYRAKRAEIPANVDGIRVALLAYDAAFDTYLAVPEPVPVDPAYLGKLPNDWVLGSNFDELDWRPDGQVRGTYWVELSPDGLDFTVYGACDVDGDGEPAIYTATGDFAATLETASFVY